MTRFSRIGGRVQGVGFRPFVYRLANSLGLNGEVKNCTGVVEIHVQGELQDINTFHARLIDKAPPLAEPDILQSDVIEHEPFDDFKILNSSDQGDVDIHLPPDFFTCDDCLQELTNPAERRYRYPFINCTQCGPRYSIIKSIPYDRVNTTMAAFTLCEPCSVEYFNPLDRRFHAQPLACQDCGPELSFLSEEEAIKGNEKSLSACVKALKNGHIIALKGVGGYQLVCDAYNDNAIANLRQCKHRPDKPLAVMFPIVGEKGVAFIKKCCQPTTLEINQIISPVRPIVLVAKKQNSALSNTIAPGLNELGVFLPNSPLHYLLLNEMGKPLVVTSGNISGEPIIIHNREAEKKLAKRVDGFIHHNRPIKRPVDDSVVRLINKKVSVIRLGRGLAPYETQLPKALLKPVLAVGGHSKVTITLAWNNRCIVSPHISDLTSFRGQQVFNQVIIDLQHLYGVQAETILCDAHPGYFSHQWAYQQHKEVKMIFHHHAHAAVVCASFPNIKKWLCFSWDGVGLGEDNTLWGGEALIGTSANWKRVASFRPFYLTGGDKAARQPWRSEAALRWGNNESWLPDINNSELSFVAWQNKMNSPQSSAVGRLFDAAASIVLGKTHVSFEGQGPMLLEAIADETETDWIDLALNKDNEGILRSDWSALLPVLSNGSLAKAKRAAIFHNSMAQALIKQALSIREFFAFEAIGLSGGVFQNKLLTEKIIVLAEQHNMTIHVPESIPQNDGGLSFGQVIEYLASKA